MCLYMCVSLFVGLGFLDSKKKCYSAFWKVLHSIRAHTKVRPTIKLIRLAGSNITGMEGTEFRSVENINLLHTHTHRRKWRVNEETTEFLLITSKYILFHPDSGILVLILPIQVERSVQRSEKYLWS